MDGKDGKKKQQWTMLTKKGAAEDSSAKGYAHAFTSNGLPTDTRFPEPAWNYNLYTSGCDTRLSQAGRTILE